MQTAHGPYSLTSPGSTWLGSPCNIDPGPKPYTLTFGLVWFGKQSGQRAHRSTERAFLRPLQLGSPWNFWPICETKRGISGILGTFLRLGFEVLFCLSGAASLLTTVLVGTTIPASLTTALEDPTAAASLTTALEDPAAAASLTTALEDPAAAEGLDGVVDAVKVFPWLRSLTSLISSVLLQIVQQEGWSRHHVWSWLDQSDTMKKWIYCQPHHDRSNEQSKAENHDNDDKKGPSTFWSREWGQR